MFELALNCEIDTLDSLFLVNHETAALVDNKYFWFKKLEFDNLSQLTEDLNYEWYLLIIENYKLADKIIRRATEVDGFIQIISTKYSIESENIRHILANHISIDGFDDVLNQQGESYICDHVYENGYCRYCHKEAHCLLCDGDDIAEFYCITCESDLLCRNCCKRCDNCRYYVCFICEECDC